LGKAELGDAILIRWNCQHMTKVKVIKADINARVDHRASISAIQQLYPNGLSLSSLAPWSSA
jgi:hypothetical protein